MQRRLTNLRARLPHVLLLAMFGLLTSTGVASATTGPPAPVCQKGEFCVYGEESFGGVAHKFDLRTSNPEECIPLPDGFDGHSFVNRLSRDVTIYQSEECTTEGDFITYPGGGTYVPQGPFVIRALKIWD
ncbi:peptidase inhibitor family I36 protein [Amycolatopsis sp. BJA-103]|uniref:peptidase inhibitor family I36 protein n=1 Tax=unclassified Amycolatopsis TaxID=2618356 RepID=UPI000C75F040|nr:peptidase inhibitor family I36 protein [Amycolatopsis sp. BJA-103]AUI57040.1 hypothetical protein BKN51_01665 [Amycolatopsis sp. BJA-103]PNE15316.1 hypothetical protein B1H26_30035 [Amycolatopsis sp. BJA-103]